MIESCQQLKDLCQGLSPTLMQNKTPQASFSREARPEVPWKGSTVPRGHCCPSSRKGTHQDSTLWYFTTASNPAIEQTTILPSQIIFSSETSRQGALPCLPGTLSTDLAISRTAFEEKSHQVQQQQVWFAILLGGYLVKQRLFSSQAMKSSGCLQILLLLNKFQSPLKDGHNPYTG